MAAGPGTPGEAAPRTAAGERPADRARRLATEFFWVGAGQVAAVLGGLVGIRALTQALSPATYGELALGMTMVTLAQQAVLGPVAGAVLRFFAPAQEAGRLAAYLKGTGRLVAQGTWVLLAVGAVTAVVLLVFGQTRWLPLVLAAFLFSLLSGYCSNLDGIQNAARQRTVVAWHQGIGQWLRFGLALGLIAVVGPGSAAAMAGYAAASALVLGSQWVLLQRRILVLLPGRESPDDDTVRGWTAQMRSYAWPFAAWGVFTWTQMASDRWALQAVGGSGEVGLYAALYQLGYYPMTLFSGFLVQLASPILFSRAGDGTDPGRMAHSRRLNRGLLMGSLGILAVGVGGAALFHREILSLFAAPEYRLVSPLLPVMVLSGGLFAAGQIAVLSLLSGVDSRRLLAPKIVTAVLGVVLNFAGAWRFGIRGVVYAGLGVSALYLAWILALVSRAGMPAARSQEGPA